MSSFASRVFNPLTAFALAAFLLGVGLAARSSAASIYEFSTLLGATADAGSADGVGPAARFDTPPGLAIDRAGNLFVADSANETIRKITPDGAVTTLAGSPHQTGSTDATGSNARFWLPRAVAVDRAGTVYVLESGSVRKVTSAGVVTTLAGAFAELGSADGIGSAARFWGAQGIAVDDSGNVFVADTGNNAIRKITPDGVVSTFAGAMSQAGGTDGIGAAARFHEPSGIAADAAGNLFVADTYSHTIRKITPAGDVTTVAGLADHPGKADGVGSAARFNLPTGIAVDSAGTLYVGDGDTAYVGAGTSRIRRITPDGNVTTVAGSATETGFMDGPASVARFRNPNGLAVDATGNVYVADSSNHAIRKVTRAGEVTTFAGAVDGHGSVDSYSNIARLSGPAALALHRDGSIYIADRNNHTVRRIVAVPTKFDVLYTIATIAGIPNQPGSGDGPRATAQFNLPSGVATDSAGNVFVSDTGNHTLRKITPTGTVATLAGLAGQSGGTDGPGAIARFNRPAGLAVDAADNLYVADSGNHTVRKITGDGSVTTYAGTTGVPGTLDGPRTAALLDTPRGLTFDPAGNLYIAQGGSSPTAPPRNVRRIAPDGTVSTLDLAGDAVAADRAGNLFALNDDTILRRTPDGAVRVVGGKPGQIGSMDGSGTLARFRHPQAIAVDSNTLFVADTDNNLIRLGAFNTAGWMANISTRSLVGTGDNVQIAGFVIPGPDPRPVLIRAAGPAIGAAPFKVAGALADPVLRLFQGQTMIASNTVWGTAANAAAIKSTAYDVGAFTWPDDSKDSALFVTLAPGAYTAMVSSQSGTPGTALVEVYDASIYFSRRLINISGRTLVGSGDEVQIAGFVVQGPQAKEVLIRVSGPTLTSAFNVPGAIPDPVLELFDSNGERIARNNGWNGDSEIRAAAARVGAFAWPDQSWDAALHVTLPPGLYTAKASSFSGATGTALIEIYDDDPRM